MARPHIVGGTVAGALALVVTAMFTMAELANRVGTHSARLHALDVVAIEVETTRHQLGVATLLRDSDTAAATADVAKARTTLVELASVQSSGLGLVGSEMAAFVETGDVLASAIANNEPSDQLDHHLGAFAAAHESLVDHLNQGRAENTERVDSTNRLLSRFGAFGGGLMAFIVPLVALYVQRRVGQRRLASYEFDANIRWLLTAEELAKSKTISELEACLECLDREPKLVGHQLRELVDRLKLSGGQMQWDPEPVDVVELFTHRPEFPGLQRLVRGDDQPLCQADPDVLSAALTSIEWAVYQAGADELILSTHPPDGSWQQFEFRGEGAIDTNNLAEVVGPLRSVETALASTGLQVSSDRDALCWAIDFPLVESSSA